MWQMCNHQGHVHCPETSFPLLSIPDVFQRKSIKILETYNAEAQSPTQHLCLLRGTFVFSEDIYTHFIFYTLWKYYARLYVCCSNVSVRLPYNLYCVGGDVKHCTIQSSNVSVVDSWLIDWLSMVLRLHQHNIGYMADGFYRSDDPTNSVKHWRRVVSHPDRPWSNNAHLTVLQYYNMHADITQENNLTHTK